MGHSDLIIYCKSQLPVCEALSYHIKYDNWQIQEQIVWGNLIQIEKEG